MELLSIRSFSCEDYESFKQWLFLLSVADNNDNDKDGLQGKPVVTNHTLLCPLKFTIVLVIVQSSLLASSMA